MMETNDPLQTDVSIGVPETLAKCNEDLDTTAASGASRGGPSRTWEAKYPDEIAALLTKGECVTISVSDDTSLWLHPDGQLVLHWDGDAGGENGKDYRWGKVDFGDRNTIYHLWELAEGVRRYDPRGYRNLVIPSEKEEIEMHENVARSIEEYAEWAKESFHQIAYHFLFSGRMAVDLVKFLDHARDADNPDRKSNPMIFLCSDVQFEQLTNLIGIAPELVEPLIDVARHVGECVRLYTSDTGTRRICLVKGTGEQLAAQLHRLVNLIFLKKAGSEE